MSPGCVKQLPPLLQSAFENRLCSAVYRQISPGSCLEGLNNGRLPRAGNFRNYVRRPGSPTIPYLELHASQFGVIVLNRR